jgi:hypothetical protein
MMWQDALRALRRWRSWLPARRRAWRGGDIEVADARRLADAERAVGGCPTAVRDSTNAPSRMSIWRWCFAPSIAR